MKPRLENKTALITGAASGIGSAIAELFAREGASLALLDVDIAAAETLARELADSGHRAIAVQADVSDADEVQHAVTQAQEALGRIDILINGAGINVFRDPLTLSEADWQRNLGVNLQGAWHCARAVLPSMLEASYGHIVNIASVHGHKIIPGSFPYPVAKHGLIGLTRALGLEYAARGIRVNSISPGLILTPAAERYFESCPDPEAERRRQTELLPCKRIGTSEEVAYAALFLASDEARFINATDLLVDGGRSQLYHA
ncbi:SDR family oxidoreductase [Dyella nitratireducens]|uniref:Short-chain dehydrogenase/reductase n=1 Tax=Dyella nitratireducens TaxID=1849580 RepID=A0ABQ1GDX6_9GAMM|nr:SDR family oxidoreductase [Dyella nitratireducens]GGA41799.1 short-chain dehydrogenase/reductase [Dyella nitratireducens]GLQ42092.1 short-chain dehydrogenase/reductase [Dyella nitratireducens]